MQYDLDGYAITSLNTKDFRRVKALREQIYGPFSHLRFLDIAKTHPDRIVTLYSHDFPEPQAYMMLHIRPSGEEKDEAWIYQIGFNPYIPLEGLEKLVDYAEFYYKTKKFDSIRMLVRRAQGKLADILVKRGWNAIDRIAIYEKNDISNIPSIQSLPKRYKIMEADPEIHLRGVVNVDRSAFRVGHRVPLETIKKHLNSPGAFVVVDTEENDLVVGYNYNSINTNRVAHYEENDLVVGYNYNSINTNRVAHFIRLATLANYTRRGIGSFLLGNALIWFNHINVENVYLRAIPDSAGARLYEKFGFYSNTMECTFEIRFDGKPTGSAVNCFE